MGYWKDMYGEQTKDFIKGVIAAVECYGVWKDGIQTIGILEIPIKDEIEEIKKDLGWPEGRVDAGRGLHNNQLIIRLFRQFLF